MDNVFFPYNKDGVKEVVDFTDGRMMPKNESTLYIIMKRIFIVLIIIVALGSVVFGEFLLAGESILVWVGIFVILGYLIKNGGYERKECPAQLQFYDDYMIFFMPRYKIKKNKYRMEISKIYYKDISACKFRTNVQKMVIYGMMDVEYFEYNCVGNIKKTPNYQKRLDGIIKFYTVFDGKHNFVDIIEKNTPIKVEIENS